MKYGERGLGSTHKKWKFIYLMQTHLGVMKQPLATPARVVLQYLASLLCYLPTKSAIVGANHIYVILVKQCSK